MRPISERQYENAKKKGSGPRWNGTSERYHEINDAIEDSLRGWKQIIANGRPRPIAPRRPGPADAIFFSDGSSEEGELPKVGAVLVAWWRSCPVAFSKRIPKDRMDRWLPRSNQIALVEIFAAVMTISHFGPELQGKRVIGLIDSECALDALIKGNSKFEDVIGLIRVFWELIAEFQIEIYLDRVSTDANPSDGMSRDGEQEARDIGWLIEEAKFPEVIYRSSKNKD